MRTFRKKLTKEQWEEVRTAHASGIPLREIARNLGLPAGTVLMRAKRERWTQRLEEAKGLKVQGPCLSVADVTAQGLGEHSERTRNALARCATQASEHAARQNPDTILRLARPLRDVSVLADTVHGWKQQGVQVGVQINLGGEVC